MRMTVWELKCNSHSFPDLCNLNYIDKVNAQRILRPDGTSAHISLSRVHFVVLSSFSRIHIKVGKRLSNFLHAKNFKVFPPRIRRVNRRLSRSKTKKSSRNFRCEWPDDFTHIPPRVIKSENKITSLFLSLSCGIKLRWNAYVFLYRAFPKASIFHIRHETMRNLIVDFPLLSAWHHRTAPRKRKKWQF